MKKKEKKFLKLISRGVCPICGGDLIVQKVPDKIKKKFLIFTYYLYKLPDHEIICNKNKCKLITPSGYEIRSIQQIGKPKNENLRVAYEEYYSGCDEDCCMM